MYESVNILKQDLMEVERALHNENDAKKVDCMNKLEHRPPSVQDTSTHICNA